MDRESVKWEKNGDQKNVICQNTRKKIINASVERKIRIHLIAAALKSSI